MSFGYVFISVTTLFYGVFISLSYCRLCLIPTNDGKVDDTNFTKIISSQGVGHRTGIEPVTLNLEGLSVMTYERLIIF